MKKTMATIILIIAFSWLLAAPPSHIAVIVAPEPIRPYEALWTATCKVESNFNAYAIGDKHLRNKSYGIVQIRQSRLDDYYRQTGIRYSTKDMFNPEKSKEVFMFYARGSNLEKIAREWNGGHKGMNKKATIKYWNKIKSNL